MFFMYNYNHEMLRKIFFNSTLFEKSSRYLNRVIFRLSFKLTQFSHNRTTFTKVLKSNLRNNYEV